MCPSLLLYTVIILVSLTVLDWNLCDILFWARTSARSSSFQTLSLFKYKTAELSSW